MLSSENLRLKSESESLEHYNLTVDFKLQDLDSIPDHYYGTNFPPISTYSNCDLTYDNFLKQHMHRNAPCVIKGVASEWGSSRNWVKDNMLNFEYLLDKFGDAIVPVANCRDRYYNAQKKEEQTLKQFIDYWKFYILKQYSPDLPCYYLKDWHCMRDFANESIYNVPIFFASDWLNEYFISREDLKDDYRFVYMGPKGSWTPFHADVFSSFSWSVNVHGKKRWVLFPPGQEKCLMDKHGNLAYDIDSPSLQDSSQYRDYQKLVCRYEIIQQAGDAIFVPSGWYHQVWNLEDTISINHNWVNGLNIDKMWDSLRANLDAVKKEISDCRDMEGWEEHCQLMLNASYGLDLRQFCQFLLYIVNSRLEHLQKNKKLKLFNGFLLEESHMKLDIFQAKKILSKIVSDPDFTKLKCAFEEVEILRALKEIDVMLDT